MFSALNRGGAAALRRKNNLCGDAVQSLGRAGNEAGDGLWHGLRRWRLFGEKTGHQRGHGVTRGLRLMEHTHRHARHDAP